MYYLKFHNIHFGGNVASLSGYIWSIVTSSCSKMTNDKNLSEKSGFATVNITHLCICFYFFLSIHICLKTLIKIPNYEGFILNTLNFNCF